MYYIIILGDLMKKNMNVMGMIILIIIFALFYLVANFFLAKDKTLKQEIDNNTTIIETNKNYNQEKQIVSNLYNQIRILYDVVNNRFKVSQEDIITLGDITYKKITNFDEVMNNLFTENGIKEYISDMGSYFANTASGYYLAGNLVSYQTYYFRGDKTNIYVTDAKDNEINAIIYEKWTSNNKNTLATVKVVYENNRWLMEDVNILATE